MKQMTEEQRKEFEKLANKMAKFINDNFNSHHIIVIDNDRADIYNGRYGYPMSTEVLASVSNSYYWIINQNTYSVDGREMSKGRMDKIYKGQRAIINKDWRKATEEEINTKQWYKGHYFNLSNV